MWLPSYLMNQKLSQDNQVGAPHPAMEQAMEQTRNALAQQAQAHLLDMAHVLIRDPQSRIIYWNHGMQQLYGWTEEEALGRVSHDLFQTRFPVSKETTERALIETGEWKGELVHICKDGSRIVVASHQTLHRDSRDEPASILEVNNDITAFKQAERALQHSEAHLAGVLGSAMDAILTIDSEQRIRFFNAAAEQMFRCLAAEVEGQSLERFIPARFHKLHAQHIRAFGQTGVTNRSMTSPGRLVGQRADGEEFPIEASISQTEVAGEKLYTVIIRDITERERAEETLQARERQLSAIINSSNDAIFGKTLEGIITSWNPGAERLYGYSTEEAIGQSVSMLIPPERLEELTDILARLRRAEYVEAFETVRICKDGTRLDVSVSVSPIRNADGQVVGASTIARDITAYKRLQAAEANRILVLETANRVALDILASRTGVEALRHIAEAARTLVQARYAALGVARLDGEGLSAFVTAGLTPEQEAEIGPRPSGLGILGLILKCPHPLRIDILSSHPASVGFPPHHPPMDSFLGVPIRRGDTVLGSLYLTNKENGEAFTPEDEVAIEALGAYAAVAINNLQLLTRQRALVRSLIAAQEEERRAVAYDLHDGLTQFVMASHAHLEAFKRAYESGNQERAERQLDQGLRYLKESVVESRRLVNGLRSLALDDLGLAGALEQLIVEEKARAGWQHVDFLHNIAGHRFDVAVETAAYRVAQEALTNVRKHARTERVRVHLIIKTGAGSGPSWLTLEIHDSGAGFVPEEKMAEEGRVGLHSMRERVQLLGGTYLLESAPGKGTSVRASFPALEPKPEAN